ncbi:MAG: HlyD family efflux transporter periplasmic adaptor subunit [Planctomycetaceae bacterium]|nr:HlyD family efflux transporter periplasmic adaptor subunit [Planctomycetaceae bacterium]
MSLLITLLFAFVDAVPPVSAPVAPASETRPVRRAAESPYPPSDALLAPAGGASLRQNQPPVIGNVDNNTAVVAQPVGENKLQLVGCMVYPIKRKDATVSANVQGKLTELAARSTAADGSEIKTEIREGMTVVAGQILGVQDDRTTQAALQIALGKHKIAEAEAKKEVEVLFAQRGAEAAQTRVDMYNRINARTPRAVAELEVLEAELESRKAVANLELAKYNLNVVKKTELELQEDEVIAAKVALERQQLIAPFDGVIIEIQRTTGEWLREGDPVLHIVQLDAVELHGYVDYRRYSRTMLQDKLVTVDLNDPAGNQLQFKGRVAFINPVIGAQGMELHIEMQNTNVDGHWQLSPGMQINAMIHLDQKAEM